MFTDPRHKETADAFLRSIAAKPGDGLPRLVFADWLDENGYTNAAAGQRWAAKHGKHAMPATTERDADGNITRQTRGGWYFGAAGRPEIAEHQLPDPFFHVGGPDTFHFPLWTAASDGAEGTLKPETAFLHRTHAMSFHPDTGEPLERGG